MTSMSEHSPELAVVADRLAGLSDEAYADVLASSYREFAAGEGKPDPVGGCALHASAGAVERNREGSA